MTAIGVVPSTELSPGHSPNGANGTGPDTNRAGIQWPPADLPTETAQGPDKSKPQETSQGLHSQAEAIAYADLDRPTKTVILSQIREIAKTASQLQQEQTDGYKNDRVFYDAVANIYNNPKHKQFFTLVQQAQAQQAHGPEAGHAAHGQAAETTNQQIDALKLTEFSRDEMIILDAALRKRADQLAYSMGLRRSKTNKRIEWQGDEMVTKAGFMGIPKFDYQEPTGKKTDRFKTGELTLDHLKTRGYLTDLGAPATDPLRYLPIAESLRFHEYPEAKRLRMIAEAQNASIAFREQAFNMKAENDEFMFSRDDLSLQVSKQLERLLEQRGMKMDALTALPERDFILLNDEAISAAIAVEAQAATLAVIENQRDTEFLRDDHIATAEHNAAELRKKTTQTWTEKKSDGSTTPITSEAAYNKRKDELAKKKQKIDEEMKPVTALVTQLESERDGAPARLTILQNGENARKASLIEADVALTRLIDFNKKKQREDRQKKLETDDIADGKNPKTNATILRKRTPGEVEAVMKAEEKEWREALDKKAKAEAEEVELARLKAKGYEVPLKAAQEQQARIKKRLDNISTIGETPVEVLPPAIEAVAQKIEYVTGHGDAKRTPVKRLNHIAEVMYTPHRRDQSLESFDNLQKAIFMTEENPELHKQIMESGALPDNIMAQSIIDALGITKDDLVARGPFNTSPGEVDAKGRIDWTAVAGAGRTQIRMAALETYLLDILRKRSPFITTNVIMGIYQERLNAASMVQTEPVVDTMRNYAETTVSFKPAIRERT